MPNSRSLTPAPTLHLNQIAFTELDDFLVFAQANHQHWPQQVQESLRLMALNGIVEPISGRWLPATALLLQSRNFRETLEHQGCLARHRAALLMVQQLIESGALPPGPEIELYCPELLTPFAQQLQELFPHTHGSEFLPESSDRLCADVPHQDLCALTFSEASFDLVLCNELFEHLYDLPAALNEVLRVLRPGGWLVATCPLAYVQVASIVKARHRPGATPGIADQAELLTEPEFHGNPVNPEAGSLVYQIPGWDLLDQARAAGLQEPCFQWIVAPGYGVVGKEIPAVIVMMARAPGVAGP